APRLAARKVRRILIAGKPELLQEIARRIAVIAGAETGLDVSQRGLVFAEIRLLRQIADGRARLHEAGAGVRLDDTCHDLEQRRLPCAVTADQADARHRRHRQLNTGEQRRAAEGEADVLELNQRWGHRLLGLLRRLLLHLRINGERNEPLASAVPGLTMLTGASLETTGMSMTTAHLTYRVSAYNTAKQSENKMHDDTVARRFGFSGGLVPGVDVMAYMVHLPVAKWGRAFLERGLIEARFVKPVYDGESVDLRASESDGVLAIEVESRGELCATGSASLPASVPACSMADFKAV